MEQFDFVLGFDAGSSDSKALLWQRRYVSTDLEILLEHHLVPCSVTEIEKDAFEYERSIPISEFGTGTVAFLMGGKLRYYRVGGSFSRTAVAVPKWQSALVKLLCILGWVERKHTGEQPAKGFVRFMLPLNEYAFAATLAKALREAIALGYECNGKQVELIRIETLRCSPEVAGLVLPYAESSAAIVAGHADLTFGLALKGAIAPDLSFVIEGAGCLQVLRISSVPYRSELEGARAVAMNNFKYFATDGLSVAEVKRMLKDALKTYALRNGDRFQEMRSVLRDYGIETVPFAGGSAALFNPILAEAVGVNLVYPAALSQEFTEVFGESDPSTITRFLDIFGVWKQIPFLEDYFEGLAVVEAPTQRISGVKA